MQINKNNSIESHPNSNRITSEISAPKNLPYAVCLSGMLLEDLLEFLEQGLGEDANRRGSSLLATNRDIGE